MQQVMTMMKRKFFALALVLALLAGCVPELSRYPRASSAPAPELPETVLTMDLPRDAGEAVQAAVGRFAAEVLELSGGAVTIELVPNREPLPALTHGATHLALVETGELVEAEPSLAFLEWPFLVSGPEEYLTAMGAEEGPVRGDPRLAETLGGEVLGLWYGGSAVLLGRGSFYEEICFSNSGLGVLEGLGGSSFFTGMGEDLGAEEVHTGEPEALLEMLADRTVKYTEYPLSALDPAELPEEVHYLETTRHRTGGLWLVLREGAVSPEVEEILRAAAAAAPETALEEGLAAEEALLAAAAEGGIRVDSGDYSQLTRASAAYFREHWQELGCPSRAWEFLDPLLRP